MPKCWDCHQEKPVEELAVTGSAHINRGSQPHEWKQILTCSACQEEQRRLKSIGADEYGSSVRQARVHELKMNLREFALHSIGPDISRLSAIERGYVEATAAEKVAIADAINNLRIAKGAGNATT